ncbi:MAG: hypothetical protein M1830_004854 [Pleopsidium flavum]|nr:MAG: hypothetical protein M1830_004854 [Pleopsidium flavum]
MGRPKRKASQADLDTPSAASPTVKKGRRSSGKVVAETAATSRPRRSSAGDVAISAPAAPKKRGRPAKAASKRAEVAKAETVPEKSTKAGKAVKAANSTANDSAKPKKTAKAANGVNSTGGSTPAKPARAAKAAKASTKASKANTTAPPNRRDSEFSVEIPAKKGVKEREDHDEEVEDEDGPSYWLMKAEPDSRMEKGVDVKFSIDDLKNAKEPEGWDGVPRNNMRAMRQGDLAFFYHSNCKVPGIAGIMEIVREHSLDESAFDPNHPYYDPNSSREKPKWDLVHVEFRQKFNNLVKLKDLQGFAKSGGVLEKLQTLRQSRLSVSKVTNKEWDFILNLAEDDEEPAAVAQASVVQGNDLDGELDATLAADDSTAEDANVDHPETVVTNGFVAENDQEHHEVANKKREATAEMEPGFSMMAQEPDNHSASDGKEPKQLVESMLV